MTTPTDPDAAVPPVVPRWEWRTFGHLDRADDPADPLSRLAGGTVHESDESYLVSLATDASVKLRAGAADVKVLQRVDGAGLQLWEPVAKAPFPVEAGTLSVVFAALGVPAPPLTRDRYTLEQVAAELLAPRDDLRAVRVHKRRTRSVLDGCMAELTDVTVGATTTRTVAVESPDPALVTATVQRLGLAGRHNTCVARGLKSLLGWRPDRFAVIDVGTNSVKLTLGDGVRAGALRTLTDRAVVTRLGEGMAEAGRLTQAAVERTVEAVCGMADEARRDGPVDVVAVGTAGLRQAPNRDDLVDAAFARCGVAVEVVSGREEARLAYLAAVSSLPSSHGRLLVFDSGGGSSQFTVGVGADLQEQFSVDVGAVRFTERFGLAGAVPRETVEAACAAIARDLARLEALDRPEHVIGMGGTSTNLAAVRHGLHEYDPDVVHGTVLDLAEVDRQIEEYRQLSAEERRQVVGLQPARAEVILAGACVVRTILELTGREALTVSDRGLRHGVVAERFGSTASGAGVSARRPGTG